MLSREALTFRAFDQIFDSLARFLSRRDPAFVESIAPPGISALVTLFPVLQNVQTFAKKLAQRLPTSDPQELRQQAFLALRKLVENLGEQRKVILCIDDAHHADLASFALVKALLKSPSPTLFVIFSYHSEAEAHSEFLLQLREWLHTEAGNIESSELEVEQLNDVNTRELFELRLGEHLIDSEVMSGLVQEAGGNPFFVELLSSALIDAQSGLSSSKLDSSVDEDSQPPLTLSYIFRRRLKQLPGLPGGYSLSLP